MKNLQAEMAAVVAEIEKYKDATTAAEALLAFVAAANYVAAEAAKDDVWAMWTVLGDMRFAHRHAHTGAEGRLAYKDAADILEKALVALHIATAGCRAAERA